MDQGWENYDGEGEEVELGESWERGGWAIGESTEGQMEMGLGLVRGRKTEAGGCRERTSKLENDK